MVKNITIYDNPYLIHPCHAFAELANSPSGKLRHLKDIPNTEIPFFTYSAHECFAILLTLIMQETTEIGTARIHGSVQLRFGYHHFPMPLNRKQKLCGTLRFCRLVLASILIVLFTTSCRLPLAVLSTVVSSCCIFAHSPS